MSEDRIEGALKKGVGHVQDAVGGLSGDSAIQAKGKLNEVTGSVQNAYGKARDQAQDVVDQARDRAQDAYSDLEQFVRDQPHVALGIGVAVGLALGLMLARSRKIVYLRE
ncbi:CsbD family protein [Caulobacter sp. S45]|uniref:CsbD family protein n=1 Tax=Caulobacter sp. S45 TaxID=1641861 RepID=UPI00131DA008|nr:CsbD family protein [Caulobacter sp. S45]